MAQRARAKVLRAIATCERALEKQRSRQNTFDSKAAHTPSCKGKAVSHVEKWLDSTSMSSNTDARSECSYHVPLKANLGAPSHLSLATEGCLNLPLQSNLRAAAPVRDHLTLTGHKATR